MSIGATVGAMSAWGYTMTRFHAYRLWAALAALTAVAIASGAANKFG